MASTAGGAAAGPGLPRWDLAEYRLVQRMGPRGKRFVVLDPEGAAVATCVLRKDQRDAVFSPPDQADGADQAWFRLQPKKLKLFAAAFDVLDAQTGARLGELRKREYRSVRKEEWLILDGEGEHVGMVIKNVPRLGALQEVQPFRIIFPLTYQVHWGQSVAGTIQLRSDVLLNDHVHVDLSLDPRQHVDRRLVLAVAYCIRDCDRLMNVSADS